MALAADPKASQYYEDALVRFEKKDHKGAIVQLKNALKIDRKNLAVQLLLGRVLLAQGEAGPAEVAFDEALRLGVNRAEVVIPMARAVMAQGRPEDVIGQPRFVVAGLPTGVQVQLMLLRAAAMTDVGDSRNAIRTLEEARALDPGSAEGWISEVPVRIRARQFREAQTAADKALSLAPNSADAMYQRGTVSHVQGDIEVALTWYDKALVVQPLHVEARVSRAGTLMDLGRFDAADKDVSELLRTTTQEPRANYIKSLLAERAGNAAAARAALNEVTALLDPIPMQQLRFRPQALMLGGLSHYGLKQFEKARPYLEMVLRAQPSSPVSKLLGQIYLTEKNVDKAVESLDAYLRSHPNDRQGVLLLASAHMSQGRYARATQLTQDALKLEDAPAVRTLLGLSLMGSGKVGDAVAALEAAFKKDPSQVQAGTALVTLYLQSGQATRAATIAESLVKQQSGNPGLQHLLGIARERRGDEAGARVALEQALKIDPKFNPPQVALARLDAAAGQYVNAGARLAAVLARDEKNIDALSGLAAMSERRNQLADAQRWYEKADDFAGTANVQPGLALVDFHLRQGRQVAAKEALKRVTFRAPEDMQVLLATARVALANGDPATARGSLTRAATLANFNAPLLAQIALLQIQAGHVPGAAHTLEKALSERPDLLPAQVLLAEVETRQGEFVKAEQRARQIAARNPKLGIGSTLLGDLASARNQKAAAIEHYKTAHRLDNNSDTLLRLYSALASSNPQAAGQLADQWVRTNPKDVAVRRALADGHARAGNFVAARLAYEELVKSTPRDAEVLNNLANVLVQLKDPTALQVAEAALAQRPGAAHIIGTVGWAAFKSGQTDRALQLLRDARLRSPNNPDTRYFLGAVLASAGRAGEARAELEGALKDSPGFAHAGEAQTLLRTLR